MPGLRAQADVPVAARIAAATPSGAWSATNRPTPAGKMSEVTEPVVRTYLELDDPAGLRPAGPPRLEDVEIERVAPPDG